MVWQAPKKDDGEDKPAAEVPITGPNAREGEHVFGVAHIFASFNDTFVVRTLPRPPVSPTQANPPSISSASARCSTVQLPIASSCPEDLRDPICRGRQWT